MRDTRDIHTICLKCFGTIDPVTHVCENCHEPADEITPVSALPVRTMLGGRYLMGLPLGRGGFGITYKAYDTLTCTRVAIKEFFPKGYTVRVSDSCAVNVSSPSFFGSFNYWLTAFIQEAKILTSIKHLDGIVTILDFFLTNGTAYIVMEYLEGTSLYKLISARGGRLQLTETLNIMRPVLETLHGLHQHGIIHKDISPENIQIIDHRFVKLIDFGAASIYTQNVAKPFFVLKKGYSPIELYATNGYQGPWTDLYEIAATIYTCLVGNPPPEASERYRNDKIVTPSALNVHIQPVRERALMKALAVNPKERYSNVAAFQQMFFGEFLPNSHIHSSKLNTVTTGE